jgi:hypothetical protein
MMGLKGTETKTINIIIGLVISLAVALVFLALFLPAIMSSDDAASCVGFLRGVASIIGNLAGANIC